MDPTRLPLRDVHLPPSPSWWPLAPGWWLLAAAIALPFIAWLGWRTWRMLRRRRWERWFDAATAKESHPERVAAISELLRRAARRRQAGAELLEGEAWLHFLDGARGHAFSDGAGRLLLDGAFRPQLEPGAFAAANALARTRFLELMEGRR
ncbi:DUF4381 domain-containing protein [Pseudoxanthomonas daejeonensis]|uniref:DUF4381 domain-containing protein n=1 Tax=Pseudoxanthomonas daejeonensis TaxID=266062 RepID=UPI001F5479D3|nr:DUF4381 domain-containing protein [Pseudoxanthomonas daejeonensis]UNK58092.1 DUF4381 domain-containing protein [Pseudoxanthomonas daejeonensis]